MSFQSTSLINNAFSFSFHHLQIPLWLFKEDAYRKLSLTAIMTYSFLLNRFSLSKENSRLQPGKWVNGNGDLYIIYPRSSLAADMRISPNSAGACMKELAAANLILEERQGQGKANKIYLVDNPLLHSTLKNNDSSLPELNPQTDPPPKEAVTSPAVCSTASAGFSEPQKPNFSTPKNRASETANFEYQEPQKLVTNYINQKYLDKNSMELESVCQSTDRLNRICENAGLKKMQDPAYGYDRRCIQLMNEAVRYLYFLDELRIGKACYPQEYIRDRLEELSVDILDMALERLRQCRTKIRNTLVYSAKTLFSCIIEFYSCVAADPYMEALRKSRDCTGITQKSALSDGYAECTGDCDMEPTTDGMNGATAFENNTQRDSGSEAGFPTCDFTDECEQGNAFVNANKMIPAEVVSEAVEPSAIVEKISKEMGLSPAVTELFALHMANAPEAALLREAELWRKAGISSVREANTYLANKPSEGVIAQALYRALGEQSRRPTISETRLIAYAAAHQFGPEIVELAVKQTLSNCGRACIEYTRSLLEAWNRAGLHDPALVQDTDTCMFSAEQKPQEISEWENEWLKEVAEFHMKRGGDAWTIDGGCS